MLIIMHIPDYYLNPYILRIMGFTMLIIWLYAGARVISKLEFRQLPLLISLTIFSQFISMFNVPIAGGTIAHLVGAAVIAILLGPWAAVLSISLNLVIQALLFSYGEIYSLGVNCFNMALVMPFVAFFTYRLISNDTPITSSRRVLAAAIAGWASLIIGAAIVGFELGIQPIVYRTAEGMPIGMPYPLSVTLPAMVLGHALSFAIVEGLLTAVIFFYIRRRDASLLYDEDQKRSIILRKKGF